MAVLTPYMKYPGGKRQLADRILAKFSPRGDTSSRLYVEPFFGAGAVFFAGISTGGAFDRASDRALIADINPRIMDLHRAVRDHVEDLISTLDTLYWGPAYADLYYAVRSAFNSSGGMDVAGQAAQLLWLNRACFNGMYRENSAGEFNVPVGRYKTISPPDYGNLRACSAALQRATLLTGDFDATIASALELTALRVRDIDLYADPPYVENVTSGFTGYSAGGFTADDQIRLTRLLRALGDAGARVVTSNHDLPVVRELYAGWDIESVDVRRSVGRNAESRKKVGELIMVNPGVLAAT